MSSRVFPFLDVEYVHLITSAEFVADYSACDINYFMTGGFALDLVRANGWAAGLMYGIDYVCLLCAHHPNETRGVTYSSYNDGTTVALPKTVNGIFLQMICHLNAKVGESVGVGRKRMVFRTHFPILCCRKGAE